MRKYTYILIFIMSVFAGKVTAQCVVVGPNQSICQNATTSGLGGSLAGGDATTAIWTSSVLGDTFIPDRFTLNATWTPPLDFNGTVTLTLTATNGTCLPTTASLQINVSASPVSISIGALANSICLGTSVTFSAAGINGGLIPVYQWKVNGSNVGLNSSGFTYVPAIGDAVTCVLTSNANCPTNNPATSNTVNMIVFPILPVSVSISASANPVCSGASATFTAIPVNGGASPAYQWKVNGANMGTNSSTFTYTPVNNEAVTCVMTSNELCTSGNPATSNTVTMIVNLNLPVSVSIVASVNPVCAGSSVTLTATAINGGLSPVYQWKLNTIDAGTNSSTFSYTPLNGDAVSCVLTSNAICPSGSPATSNQLTMIVNPILPVSVSVIASANPVCSGTSVTFTAVAVNGGATPAYQWKVNGANTGTNSSSFIYTPLNGDAVTCVLTSNATCPTGSPATSNSVAMTVNPGLPVSVSISASSNPVCSGNPVTFTATAVNGGTTPAYQWKVNNVNTGTNSSVFSYTPVTGNTVTCVLTSNAVCATGSPATSNTVTMTVNLALPVSISISASASLVCSGASVTFTAATVNGGATPAYQWKVNGSNIGTNSATFAYSPVNNDAVSCVLTASASCATGNPATSNSINMAVTPTVGNPLTPTPSATTVCQGSVSIFTTSAANATSYNWTVTGTGNTISGSGTTGTVNWAAGFSGTATVSVTANGCNGPSVAASTGVTARSVPIASISGTTSVCQNAASPVITFTNPNTMPVTITYNINGANPTSINVAANNTASLVVPTASAGAFAYNLVSVIYQAVPGCSNSITGTATVTVNPFPAATLVSSDADNILCAGSSITFTAGGGTNYNFRVGGTSIQNGATSFYTTSLLTNGQVVDVIVTTASGCIATSAPITNFVNPLPFIIITTPPSCTADLLIYNLGVTVASGIVTSTSGIVTNSGGNVWSINGVLAGTNIVVKVTDIGGCINSMAVTAPSCLCPVVLAPVSGGDKSYCALGTIPAINATVMAGETVDWYTNSSGGTPLRVGSLSYSPSAAGTYYAIARNLISGCVSSTRTPVIVTMNPLPLATLISSDTDNIICAGASVTFTAAGGTNYNFRVSGVSVQNSTASSYTTNTLTNGKQVDVIVTNSNGCIAISPVITTIVNAIPVANAGTGGNSCNLTFKFNAVPSSGTGAWTKITGPGTAAFAPNANNDKATVTVSVYGTYTFAWSEVNGGCTDSSVITVNFLQLPVVTVGPGGNNCGLTSNLTSSQNVGSGTWSKVSGTGNVLFSPDASTNDALVTVTAYGSYTFRWTVTNLTCSNSATVTVNFIQQQAADAGTGGDVCTKDFTLNAVASIGTGTWSKISGPGDAVFSPDTHRVNAKVTVTQFGSYDFAWTVLNSTCSSSDIVTVFFHDKPTVSAGVDSLICKDSSIQLHALGTGSFAWVPAILVNNPGIQDPVATISGKTTFKVTLTDQFGCKNSDSTIIDVREKSVADAGPDQVLEYQVGTTLNAALANNYETGVWSVISGSAEFFDSTFAKTSVSGLSVHENNLLWTVTNGVCPETSDEVLILVHDLVIPTLITPNMDGRNDYFVINGINNLGKTEIVIFDRRGAQVYKNMSYDNLWNGVDYNGNTLPDDTYFYVLRAEKGKSFNGFIVIRR